MEVVIKTTQVQLEHLMRERKSAPPTVKVLPPMTLSSIRLLGNRLTFYGIFHRGHGVIAELENGIEIRIKASVYWFATLLLLTWASLSFFYCFGPYLIIEGGEEPTTVFRIVIFSIFNLPVCLIYLLIFFKTKQFLQSILQELE